MTARNGGRRHAVLAARFGPWAVVTGASDGMGLGIAEELAAAGLSIVLVSRRREALDVVAERLIAAYGVDAVAIPLDLGQIAHARRLVEMTAALDIGLFVAAAGYGTSGPLAEADLDNELAMLDLNCRAVLMLSHAFARRFAARKRGGIVLFGSLVGWQGVPYAANYAATKAYVQSLAEGLRGELAPFGVEVMSAAPGPVASGFASRAQMVMNGATPAAIAARGIVAALGRRGTVVPGALGKLLTYSLMPLPRSLRVRIMTQVMRGMTKHHGTAETRQAKPA